MAINFNIKDINPENIENLKNGYGSSLSFLLNGNNWDFYNIPYDDEEHKIEKNYAYNNTELNILIDVNEINYSAQVTINYKLQGKDYSFSSADNIKFDWSIDNSFEIRENGGYVKTIDETPGVAYYTASLDQTIVRGKTYYQYNDINHTYIEVLNPTEEDNPYENQWFEAIKKQYYTRDIFNPNADSFIRLDRYGIYGISGIPDYIPRGVKGIQEDAVFSLTWDGYTLKTSHPNGEGSIKIGSTEDITIWEGRGTGDSPKILVGALGYLKDDEIFYDLVLKSGDGISNSFKIDETVFQKMRAEEDYLIVIVDNETIYKETEATQQKTYRLENNNIIFSFVPLQGENNIKIYIYTQGSFNIKDSYGIYSRNLYIGDTNNYLSFYKTKNPGPEDPNSVFIIQTDNFYFDTDLRNRNDGQKNLKSLLVTTQETIDGMTTIYNNMNSWIKIGTIDVDKEGTIEQEPAIVIANYNNPNRKTDLALTSDGIYFKEQGTTVATITGHKMIISDAKISDKLGFGDYAFIAREGGHLSLKYIGD